MARRPELREEKAYVRFINKTDRVVELIWLNHLGDYFRCQVLENDNYVYEANTYNTHPWIALDMKTKDRLHIDKYCIYFPKTSREWWQERFPDKEMPENFTTRINVSITLPVYSLQQRTLIEIRDYFQNTKDVDKLKLPKKFVDDIKRMIEYRNYEIKKHTYTSSSEMEYQDNCLGYDHMDFRVIN